MGHLPSSVAPGTAKVRPKRPLQFQFDLSGVLRRRGPRGVDRPRPVLACGWSAVLDPRCPPGRLTPAAAAVVKTAKKIEHFTGRTPATSSSSLSLTGLLEVCELHTRLRRSRSRAGLALAPVVSCTNQYAQELNHRLTTPKGAVGSQLTVVFSLRQDGSLLGRSRISFAELPGPATDQ